MTRQLVATEGGLGFMALSRIITYNSAISFTLGVSILKMLLNNYPKMEIHESLNLKIASERN